jgi:hypothetical protein
MRDLPVSAGGVRRDGVASSETRPIRMAMAGKPVPALVQPGLESSCAAVSGRPASTAVGTATGVDGTAVGVSDGGAVGVPDGVAVGVAVGGLEVHFTRTRTRATTSPSAFWACSPYVPLV